MKTRTARATSIADMDAYARSIGMKSAQEYTDHLRMHRRLDGGGRITAKDIERVRERDPQIPLAALNRLADWVNEGGTGRDRADRYCDAVAGGIERANPGVTIDRHAMYAQARREGAQFEVMELSDAATGKMDQRDAHRDQQSGIDQASRVEASKRAAMNPDAQRRADIEREVERHAPTPKFFAPERREILAQASERLTERMMKRQVRDADPNRLPDRGDDRRDDIGLAFDTLEVNEAARDELTIASNPVLEQADNAASASGERE